MNEKGIIEQEEIYSKVLRAGRRTYFFDVRSTRAGDYYLTITESKKFTQDDGSFHYKKHKIYLYKEDFAAFKGIMEEMMEYIVSEKGLEVISERHRKEFQKEDTRTEGASSKDVSSEKPASSNFTEVNFDDI